MESKSHHSAAFSDVELRLCHHGAAAVEIDLINLDYCQQRLSKLKQLIALLCLFVGYSAVSSSFTTSTQLLDGRSSIVDLMFLLCLLYIAISTLSLIKSEKLLFCLDFALQLQTERFGGRRTNVFIPASSIHDVVINEVIEDLDIHYILIVRTKGRLFQLRPIIPIFNTLRPSIDCLEIIYKLLNKKMQLSAENS